MFLCCNSPIVYAIIKWLKKQKVLILHFTIKYVGKRFKVALNRKWSCLYGKNDFAPNGNQKNDVY